MKDEPHIGDIIIFNNSGGFCSGSSETGYLHLDVPYKIISFKISNCSIWEAILEGKDLLKVNVVLGGEHYEEYWTYKQRACHEIY